MKIQYVILLFLSVITSTDVTPDYNEYAFSISWMNGSCADMKGAKQTMCYQKLKNIPKNQFSIHGLWPGNLTGEYIADCNGNLTTEMIEEAKSKEGELFNEKMKKYWVSYSESDEEFWIHEYNKHGNCYTNKMKENDFVPYFKKAMSFLLDNGFNDFFLKAFPGIEKKTLTISKQDLRKIMSSFYPGYHINFVCDSSSTKLLSQIYFYFDIDFNPYPVPFPFSPNCGQEEEPINIIFE